MLFSLVALSFATSCTEDIEKKEDVPILVESISLNVKSVKLTISEEYTFSPIIQPENATDKTLEWKSDDTAIATVSEEGEVVAIAEGTTTITATAVGGIYATC
ncbi:MAG: Ig domain-containing protein, partial [Alistipes sp.]|nr:Ig domain-containing protein [Alistipes sp.]